MATITLEYNTRNLIAASLLEAIKKSGVFKIKEKAIEKSPYDKKFVDKIEKSRASKGKVIKTTDIWKLSSNPKH